MLLIVPPLLVVGSRRVRRQSLCIGYPVSGISSGGPPNFTLPRRHTRIRGQSSSVTFGNPGASAQPRGMHGKSRRHVGSTGPYLVRQRADCVHPRNSRRPSRPSSATFPSIMC